MSLTTYLLAAIAALPTFHEDVAPSLVAKKQAQAQVIAQAISDVAESAEGWSGTKRELATLLLTVAWHETHFSLRIHEGNCKPFECDHGRARSLWQLHVHASLPRETWVALAGLDIESTRRAAREAARALTRSRNLCSGHAQGLELVAQTLSAYAGRGCARLLPDTAARVRTYRMLLSIQPKRTSA